MCASSPPPPPAKTALWRLGAERLDNNGADLLLEGGAICGVSVVSVVNCSSRFGV